jgi:hypothetical protein
MSEIVQLTTFSILSIYRIITIIVGLLIIYLGYRLFSLGVYEKTGELKAAWGEKNLILKQAAPGIFFVLGGAFIIIFSMWKGLNIDKITTTKYQPIREASIKEEIKEVTPIIMYPSEGQPLFKKIPDQVHSILNKIVEQEQINEKIELNFFYERPSPPTPNVFIVHLISAPLK